MIEWRNRPQALRYTIVYLDALRVNARQDGKVCIKSVYVALGVDFEGKKDVLGLWIAENEGAKFWAGVLNELKNRGVEDILIACMDSEEFSETWNDRYPMIQQSWQNHWNDLCEFFKYPMRNPQGDLHH